MIANLIGGFVAILLGTSLIGPIATEVVTVSATANSTGTTCVLPTYGGTAQTGCENAQLHLASAWGATVLKLVPGFFALSILGIGIAVTYTSLRQAGVV